MEAWNKYFKTPYASQYYFGKQWAETTPNRQQVLCYQSYHCDLKPGGYTFYSDEYEVLVYECVFKHIAQESHNGGAIYAFGSTQIVLSRCLSVDCKSNQHNGQFCNVDCKSAKDKFAYVMETTIMTTDTYNCSDVIILSNARLGASYNNISNNKVVHSCGISLIKQNVDNSKVNYTLISNNHAYDTTTIYCTDAGNYDFYMCNIINNTQYSSEKGTVQATKANITLTNCSILNCDKNGTVFSAEEGTIFVVKCYTDSDKSSGSVVPKDNVHGSATYELTFYENKVGPECMATCPDFDFAYNTFPKLNTVLVCKL